MKFSDTFKSRSVGDSAGEAGRPDNRLGRGKEFFEARAGSLPYPPREAEPQPDYSRAYAVTDNGSEQVGYSAPRERNFMKSPERGSEGKGRSCGACGEVMKRSSRMVLSPVAGLLLILAGAGLMVLYGLASYSYQTPFYLQFSLPAFYYVGSLFIGVGVVFFFIRERVWCCPRCRDVRKR